MEIQHKYEPLKCKNKIERFSGTKKTCNAVLELKAVGMDSIFFYQCRECGSVYKTY